MNQMKCDVDYRPLYQRLVVGCQLSPATLEAYRGTLKLFAVFAADQGYGAGPLEFSLFFADADGPSPVDEAFMRQFFTWVQATRPGRYRDALFGMQYWLSEAVDRGMLTQSPMPPFKGPKTVQRRHDVLTPEEWDWLMVVAAQGPQPERDQFMIALFTEVGPRPTEMRRLRDGDIDVPGERILFRGPVKTFPRAAALPNNVIVLWTAYQQSQLFREKQTDVLLVGDDGEPFTEQGMRDWRTGLFERAGLRKEGGLRIFRRSMATIAYANGIPTVVIARQLGHESVRHTPRYINVDFDFPTLRAAVERGMEKL